MTAYAADMTVSAASAQPKRTALSLAWGIAASAALIVVTFGIAYGVLSSNLNWPASLTDPASAALPRIAANRGAVNIGYFAFFAASLLIIPLAFQIRRALDDGGSLLLNIAVAMGVLAALTKVIGIVRWFFVMPVLADSYTAPGASQATRDTTALLYQTVNAYFDGVGKYLGDLLFSGLWLALVAVVLVRGRQLPAWLGWSGLAVAVLLVVGFFAGLGAPVDVLLNIGTSLELVWIIAFAAAFVVRTRRMARR